MSENQLLLAGWLERQGAIQTWSADFIQTRTLKSLTQPLVATGHLWFAAPDRFRWELGRPAQTIVLRQPDRMLIVYPRLKRAERYPLDSKQAGPWREALALLEAGFPRSAEELGKRFRILSQTNTNSRHEVTLEPRLASARRWMPNFRIGFETNSLALRMTELRFADGSTLRNEFGEAEVNARLDPALFDIVIDPTFEITEPLKTR